MKESSAVCQWPLLGAVFRIVEVTSDVVITCIEVPEFWLCREDLIGFL